MIENKDYYMQTFTNSSPVVFMEITHIKTGIQVRGKGKSTYALKLKLLEDLESLVESVPFAGIVED